MSRLAAFRSATSHQPTSTLAHSKTVRVDSVARQAFGRVILPQVRILIALTAVQVLGTMVFSANQVVIAGDANPVRFDVPAMVVAERVNPELVAQPTLGGELVRFRFPVSAYVETGFSGQIAEYSVQLMSPEESLRMIDFWPRNEAYSQVAGTISVEKSKENRSNVKFSASAGVEPTARGQLSGDFQQNAATNERYERIPDAEPWTSSGTIARGYGVFFKFRPGPAPNLEGSRQLAVLAEVPKGWRADMILVRVSAKGKSSGSAFRSEVLTDSTMWMTIHQEGDMAAAARAKQFVTQERSLRAMAASHAEQIEQKSMPTVFHRVGAALSIVPPRIPANYLAQVIFGPSNQYLEGKAHRLPVDLRVAILDYWDAREALLELSSGAPTAVEHVVVGQERANFPPKSWVDQRDAS